MVCIIGLKCCFRFFLLLLPGCFHFFVFFLRWLRFLDAAQFLASILLWVIVIIVASSLDERCFRGRPLLLLILSISPGEIDEDLYRDKGLFILRVGDVVLAAVFKISFIWARVRVGTLLPWSRCDIYRSNEIIGRSHPRRNEAAVPS